MTGMRVVRIVVVLLLILSLLVGTLGRYRAGQTHVPHLRRVAVLLLENHGYNQIVGSPQAPYPFAYSEQVGEGAIARQHEVDFSSLRHDLSRHSLPRFSWITPNLLNDGHNASISVSDRFASRLVPRIVHALGPDGVLFVTWDEAQGVTGPGGGRVALIATGPGARHHVRTDAPADHYSLLATLEGGLGLSRLGKAAGASVAPLTALLERG